MSGITTHVLDTSSGRPAAQIRVALEYHRAQEQQWMTLGHGVTDRQGRQGTLLTEQQLQQLRTGRYRLIFEIHDYFLAQKIESFYPQACIDFFVKDTNEHYHIPLLLNPFGYTTYRGS